jgi:putative nucleotidyltransferase with HDIG domain
MRKAISRPTSKYTIMVVDDDQGVIDSLTLVLGQAGYPVEGFVNPLEAVEALQRQHYDMLILDFLMTPIHGDTVVEMIRAFNRDIYILLLTGYKDLAPPMETVRKLDIQGYCEKSNRFDQLTLLVESGMKSIAQMRAIQDLRDGLTRILRAAPKIYSLQALDAMLGVILDEFIALSAEKDSFVLAGRPYLDNPPPMVFQGRGRFARMDLIEAMAAFPDLMQNAQAVCALQGRGGTPAFPAPERGLMLPLYTAGLGTVGVIYTAHPEPEWQNGSGLGEIFAAQAAAAIGNSMLHATIREKNAQLSHIYQLLEKRYLDTIEALRTVVDTKDIYTRGHSDRVAFYSMRIGEALRLSADEMETLRVGSLFHDIGKVGTSDGILLKDGKLTAEEYDEIKRHPMGGVNILSALSMFEKIIPLVRSHHERVDGNGYPDGLKGDEIPFLARIVGVADAFDAMTSDRAYRSKMTVEEAIAQLRAGAGQQFDAQIVEVAVPIFRDYDQLLAALSRFQASGFSTLSRGASD